MIPTVSVKLTLGEASHLQLLLDQLGPHLDGERRSVFERIAGAIERDLKKQGAMKDETGWVWPKV